MPHLSFSRLQEGWALPLTVGVDGTATASLLSAGQPIPPPQFIRALLDTGADITGISPRILSQLGLLSIRQHTTHQLSGPILIDLFEISLTIPGAGPPADPLLVLDHLIVMGLPSTLPGIDALLGRDVLDQLLLILDGPRGELTVSD